MKITFTPHSKLWEDLIPAPIPSKSTMPEWYKKQSLLISGQKQYAAFDQTPNTTVKGCSPFADSFCMGYMWCAPVDIQIEKIYDGLNFGFNFTWRTDGEFISFHSPEQIGSMPASYDGERNVCKWAFDYGITTPPGYSTLFTHPLNRHELPFRTFSGVVDTDTYTSPVQFPFQLLDLKDQFTIIEKGTPLVQMIPIKRERWDSDQSEFNELETKKMNFEYFAKIYRAYKTRHWSRKEYY